MEFKDIIARIGYARNLAGLSAKELSLRLGKSPQYIAQVENGRISIRVQTLLDILEICDFSVEKFFHSKPEDYEKDNEINELIKSLPSNKKEHVIALLKTNK